MAPAKKICQFCGEEPELKYQGNGGWAYAACSCRLNVEHFIKKQFESKQQLVELSERIEDMGLVAALQYLIPTREEDQFAILQFVRHLVQVVPWR